MFPLLPSLGWFPTFRAPFSGDVTQEIAPSLIGLKGSPEIEARIQTEVASFGRQLGKVLEALELLGRNTGTDLPEIAELIAGVERVKADAKAVLKAEAERALARLKAAGREVVKG